MSKKFLVSCPALASQPLEIEADDAEGAANAFRQAARGLGGDVKLEVVDPDNPPAPKDDGPVRTTHVASAEALRVAAEESSRAARAASEENVRLREELAALRAEREQTGGGSEGGQGGGNSENSPTDQSGGNGGQEGGDKQKEGGEGGSPKSLI